MRVTIAVIYVFTLFAATLGLPATRRDEVEVIPLEKNPFGDQPIVDTGVVGGWNSPFPSSFGGIFENLEGIMSRMRQQMEAILKRFPLNRGNSSGEIPEFPFPGGLEPIPNIGNIDLGKGNTTSVTKVIDGHKVVINETEYKNQDDLGGTFFKVRIIDVKPDDVTTTEKNAEPVPVGTTPQSKNPQTNAGKDIESVESSIENEIPKSKEIRNIQNKNHFENIEIFDEIDAMSPFAHVDPHASSLKYEIPSSVLANQYFVPIPDRERANFDVQRQNNRKINEQSIAVPFSSTSQKLPIPSITTTSNNKQNTEWNSAESLESHSASVPFGSTNHADEWSNIESLENFDDNALNSGESLDEKNMKPIDLSSDIYVNQILADAGAPTNPDAEVFFVPQKAAHEKSPIRFEKFINPR